MTELLPCPFCGKEPEVNNMEPQELITCFNEDCPLFCVNNYPEQWNQMHEIIKGWLKDMQDVINSQREEIAELRAKDKAHGERPE